MKRIFILSILAISVYTTYSLYYNKEIFYIDSAKEILGLDQSTLKEKNALEAKSKNEGKVEVFEPWMVLALVVAFIIVIIASVTGEINKGVYLDTSSRFQKKWDNIHIKKSVDTYSSADIYINNNSDSSAN